MAKGEQRSNREAKKPKKDKIKTIAAAPSQKTAGWQPKFASAKNKSQDTSTVRAGPAAHGDRRTGLVGQARVKLFAKIDTAQNDAGRISLELPGEEFP